MSQLIFLVEPGIKYLKPHCKHNATVKSSGDTSVGYFDTSIDGKCFPEHVFAHAFLVQGNWPPRGDLQN